MVGTTSIEVQLPPEFIFAQSLPPVQPNAESKLVFQFPGNGDAMTTDTIRITGTLRTDLAAGESAVFNSAAHTGDGTTLVAASQMKIR